ncbi:hypothetical protein GQX74_009515 [Glossina fuscipes]|nr:hypothetical protein GQX74_009515 [Glossina fuscipes]
MMVMIVIINISKSLFFNNLQLSLTASLQANISCILDRARDSRTNEIVALKKVRMDQKKEGLIVSGFREILIFKSCKHENIANLLDEVLSLYDYLYYAGARYHFRDLYKNTYDGGIKIVKMSSSPKL